MDELYYLGFSVFPGVGPLRFQKLLQAFATAKLAWTASESELEVVIGKSLSEKFSAFRKTFSPEKYAEELRDKDVKFVTLPDKSYPSLLKQIKDPPFVLYVKGDEKILKQVRPDTTIYIGVVGTRKITSYGREVTEMITRDLVQAGCVIVSGLAMGVDAAAHRITVENNGQTIAVLGCGVDCCSPRENQRLYEAIITSGGTIVSEYPLSAEPTKGSFPSRNRIIAGLSHAVIVTEGAFDSGALYTANDAFENNRPVFAVPGPITSSFSNGPNTLISQGAKLITNAQDVLLELGMKQGIISSRKIKAKSDNLSEQKILDMLGNEPLHFDEIVKRTHISSSEVGVLLSMMEVKGFIKTLDAGIFSLV